MDVSIILVNYNTKKLTVDAIKSVIEHTKDINYEIIVVDNNSIDGSVKYLKEIFNERVQIIENPINSGFGSANNLGLKFAKGKYIFLLNTDTVLLNNSIKYFYDYMEVNNSVGVCGGELFNEDMTKQISYGNFPTIFQALFESLFLNKIFKNLYNSKISSGSVVKCKENFEVDYVSGANMFIRNEVLQKVGTFDEDFFLYFEETELSFRIKKGKYKSVILPKANIIHLCGKSSPKTMQLNRKEIFETSRRLFFKKCYGEKSLKYLKFLLKLKYYLRYMISRNKIYLEYYKIINKIYANLR